MVDLLTELYPHRCTITKTVPSNPEEEDAYGQPIISPPQTVVEDQPCRYAEKPTSLVNSRYRVFIDNPLLFLPMTMEDPDNEGEMIDLDITEGYLVSEIMDSRTFKAFAEGQSLYVKSVQDPGGEGDHLECELEFVT